MEYTSFDALLEQAQAAFHREMNLKNEAFLYIIQKGLFDDYCNYKKALQPSKETAHARCVVELERLYCGGAASQSIPQRQNANKKKRCAMKK